MYSTLYILITYVKRRVSNSYRSQILALLVLNLVCRCQIAYLKMLTDIRLDTRVGSHACVGVAEINFN
jgi:hypothetical protein